MGNVKRVAVHGNLRNLNQRDELAPSIRQRNDLNRQYDYYTLGAIRLPDGKSRPVGIHSGFGSTLDFYVRCASAAEAAAFAMIASDQFSGVQVFPVSDPGPFAQYIFELANLQAGEHFVRFSLTTSYVGGINKFLTMDRLKSDALIFIAKAYDLRLVGAGYVQASLEQFDRMMPARATEGLKQITSGGADASCETVIGGQGSN